MDYIGGRQDLMRLPRARPSISTDDGDYATGSRTWVFFSQRCVPLGESSRFGRSLKEQSTACRRSRWRHGAECTSDGCKYYQPDFSR